MIATRVVDAHAGDADVQEASRLGFKLDSPVGCRRPRGRLAGTHFRSRLFRQGQDGFPPTPCGNDTGLKAGKSGIENRD